MQLMLKLLLNICAFVLLLIITMIVDVHINSTIASIKSTDLTIVLEDLVAEKTRYEIVVNETKTIISDPFNEIIRSYGAKPTQIYTIKNIRYIKFKEAVILKTKIDSIDVGEKWVKLGGYMGSRVSSGGLFYVGENGDIAL